MRESVKFSDRCLSELPGVGLETASVSKRLPCCWLHTYFFHAPQKRDRRVDHAVEVLVKRAPRREPPGWQIERFSKAFSDPSYSR